MFKAAITVFCLLFLPYLVFILPGRVRRHRSARMRFFLFAAVLTLGILYLLKKLI